MPGPILIVEDETDLASTLAYNLSREGFESEAVTTGAEAIARAAREPAPSLVLLDLMLPDVSGTEVCRRIRRNPGLQHVPVIMITARAEEIDRVVGFEVGADDYVTKPFSVRELLLRVRAVLRRAQTEPCGGPTVSGGVSLGRLRVDVEGHRAWVDDRPVDLTALEFKLLLVFFEKRGRALTREALLRGTSGPQHHATLRAVDTHVKRLRQKLGPAGEMIETIRGVGYRMRSTPDEEG